MPVKSSPHKHWIKVYKVLKVYIVYIAYKVLKVDIVYIVYKVLKVN